jgi:NADH-quinone oxidoreductase subunit G
MKHVGTICTHCADGCKTTLGVRNNEIIRGNNRDRSGINGEFLCIKGRYAADFVNSPERLQSPMLRRNGGLEPVSWSEALAAAARKLSEVKARDGKFAVIGSNHTSNEENFYLQKFARQALGTSHIDHHRTGDIRTLLDALSGKQEALASTADLYDRKAILVVSSDLSQQHPFLAFQIRANYRHHDAHIYTVTPGPVREQSITVRSVMTVPGHQLADVESLRGELQKEPELVILFGDAIKGELIRQLVAFGDSLGIPVKYVCLLDYSNSRGASDMGLSPDAGPGYQPVNAPGLAYDEILAATDLDVLWVVGANPLKDTALSSHWATQGTFVIVQDLFLTETAARADILFPAASAYEKHGTVTNVCGEVQRLKGGVQVMGTKPDLEILGLLSKEMGVNLGMWSADKVFEEIRENVHGYNVPLPVLATGGAAQTAPVNGRVPVSSRPELIQSARDTLFTSGTLGRYCKKLNSTLEAPGALYSEPRP